MLKLNHGSCCLPREFFFSLPSRAVRWCVPPAPHRPGPARLPGPHRRHGDAPPRRGGTSRSVTGKTCRSPPAPLPAQPVRGRVPSRRNGQVKAGEGAGPRGGFPFPAGSPRARALGAGRGGAGRDVRASQPRDACRGGCARARASRSRQGVPPVRATRARAPRQCPRQRPPPGHGIARAARRFTPARAPAAPGRGHVAGRGFCQGSARRAGAWPPLRLEGWAWHGGRPSLAGPAS